MLPWGGGSLHSTCTNSVTCEYSHDRGRDEYKIFRDEKKGMYDAMTRDVRRTQDQACRL